MSNSLFEMQQKIKLEQVADAEAALSELTMGHTIYPLSQFVRQGLPILAGLLDDTFDARSWLEYVGHHHVGLRVVSDDLTTIVYDIPPMLGQQTSILNDDPNVPSLTDESVRLSYIRDMNPDGAAAHLYNTAVDQLEKANPSVLDEMKQNAVKHIAILNRIFADYQLGQIPLPDPLVDVEVVDEKPSETKPVQVNYDLDDGDDL